MEKRKPKETHAHIRRALSDADVIKSESSISRGSRCFPAGIPEEEYVSNGEVDRKLRTPVTGNGSDRASFAPIWPAFGISMEEIAFSGDGFGNGGKPGGNHGDDSYGDRRKIGDYYQEMLKLKPTDSLLLRNYGRFLHEIRRERRNITEERS